MSCSKEPKLEPQQSDDFKTTSSAADSIVLGAQLPNPYTVAAFEAAKQSLVDEGVLSSGDFGVQATHKYVRFLPSNNEELQLFNSDTSYQVFEFPLDYEIIEDGSFYKDPTRNDSLLNYQYTVIPINGFNFPDGIGDVEVLAEIVLDEDQNEVYDKIEEESFKLLDLWEEEDFEQTSNKKCWGCSRYRPSGRVTVDDNRLGNHGLEGASITMRRWFKTGTATTNSNGDFASNKRFRGRVRYRIQWSNGIYDIKAGSVFRAYTKGPYTRGNWNINIGKGNTYAWGAANVHIACYQFYFQNAHGLNRPPWFTIIGVRKHGSGAGNHSYARTIINGPLIQIKSLNRDAISLYGTTIHELAHAMHRLLPGDFNSVESIVKESFATGVEYYFVKERYGLIETEDLLRLNWGEQDKLKWDSEVTTPCKGYAPLFIDLNDALNQIGFSSHDCFAIGATRAQSNRGFACLVDQAPSGTTPFIWQGSFYYTPMPGNQCLPGHTFDGVNCLVSPVPANRIPFIDGQNFFVDCRRTGNIFHDIVTGYQPYQWQNALHHAYTLNGVKNRLRSLYNNPTDGHELDTLFADYDHVNSQNLYQCL